MIIIDSLKTVFKSIDTDDKKIEKKKELFNEHPELKRNTRGLFFHYELGKYEYWQLIRPIHILLTQSLDALKLFLMKDKNAEKFILGPIKQMPISFSEDPSYIRTSKNLLKLVFTTLKSISSNNFFLTDNRFFQVLIGSDFSYGDKKPKFF
ncbi:hypothetical protein [Methanospirillum sp.]